MNTSSYLTQRGPWLPAPPEADEYESLYRLRPTLFGRLKLQQRQRRAVYTSGSHKYASFYEWRWKDVSWIHPMTHPIPITLKEDLP